MKHDNNNSANAKAQSKITQFAAKVPQSEIKQQSSSTNNEQQKEQINGEQREATKHARTVSVTAEVHREHRSTDSQLSDSEASSTTTDDEAEISVESPEVPKKQSSKGKRKQRQKIKAARKK